MNYTINNDWLLKRTGDPFSDAGAWVILLMQEQFPNDDIYKLIERATRIYVEDWQGKINPFFLNSTITQPAFKGDRKTQETLDYFRRLLTDTEPHEEGYCRMLGEKTKLFRAGRDNHILSGSGTFINFHHAFQDGIKVSKEILIRTFFVPLGAVFLGNKIAVLGCNKEEVEKWFIQDNYQQLNRRIGQRQTEGILKSPFSNPANALFEFTKSCVTKYAESLPENEPVEIHLYHFTNFGASPEVELHCFSSKLFSFYRMLRHRHFNKDWERFIRDHYFSTKKAKGAIYNPDADRYEVEVKKERQTFDFDEFKTWYNPVYQKMLRGDSILRDFVRWSGKQYKSGKTFTIFSIVELYQKELRNMKQATLDKIRQLADFIVSDEDKVKNRLNKLRLGITKEWELRRFLLQLIDDSYRKNPSQPLITLQEHVEVLFPDGAYGMELRDLLIIAVYEKLCEQNIAVELDEEKESLIETPEEQD